MFLKEIHVEGFKSFAKKTIIKFDDGLVGFVGPNGSGKSNINDAIRWALGEKSIKKLRGNSNSDVIFAGSQNFSKSKFAEVSLIFDNTENLLNTEYKTVKVTRRIFRNTGENEYFINKNKVRLKEIKNLILDTGLGNSSLSIISQGTISKIAEAKPLEVRALLDEAAGVSKYQIQKSESIRKLDRVQQNLEIIEATYNELKKQVKPLLNQSEKAEKYIDLKKELKDIELSLIYNELSKNKLNYASNDEVLQNLKLERDLRKTKISNIESKIYAIDRKNLSIDKDLFDLQVNQTNTQEKINNFKSKSQVMSENKTKESYKNNLEELSSLYNNLRNESNHINLSIKSHFETQGNLKIKINNLEESVHKVNSNINRNSYDLEKMQINQDKLVSNDEITSYIMENKKIFPGIVGTLSEFIEIKNNENWVSSIVDNYVNKIIVNNEDTAKSIINFLKKDKKGTIEIIPQSDYLGNPISAENEIILSNLDGYKGTLLEYLDIHNNQLKNIISKYVNDLFVFDNYTNASKASKIIKSTHTIVSKDGFLIKDGYTIFGGESSNDKFDNVKEIELNKVKSKDLVNEKEKLLLEISKLKVDFENTFKELSFFKQKESNNSTKINEVKNNISLIKGEYSEKFGEEINIKESSSVSIEDNKNKLLSELSSINERISFLNNLKIDNNEGILNDKKELKKLNSELFEYIDKVSSLTNKEEKLSGEFNRYIEILNADYKLSYEGLMSTKRELKDSPEDAQIKVNGLKYKIEKLGYINLDSIDVYKKVSSRYEEMKNSYEDIEKSRNMLLETIKKLDTQMQAKFSDMFTKVNEEFNKIYSSTFNGGIARIQYSDDENKLESGVDIVVKPKNKTITNLSLFSGGEKAMISLAFIFSILSVKKIPFLIMDEAEAPLDESNVERYGNFCRELNKKTQVMLVTHRPGTMELCDVLYGVTMEGNAGITKIVSVKLSEAKEFIGE